jgi:hypothetical protein
VSKDGRFQLLVIQTAFPPSDAKKANRLLSLVRAATEQVSREVGPAVRFGVAGNITMSMYEHDSVLEGMTLSAVATVLLVALGLLFY